MNDSKIDILQVLTLFESNGSYGGPVSVASQFLGQFKKMGRSAKIVSGLKPSNSIPRCESDYVFFRVRPLIKKYPVSTLIGLTMFSQLYRNIRDAKIIHIHFARDLVSCYAALVCIMLRRPFFVQTHGMIRPDTRILTRVIDFFIKLLLNRAQICFFLNKVEEADLLRLGIRDDNLRLLENGIEIRRAMREQPTKPTILFCSRLHPNKNVLFFIRLADFMIQSGNLFKFVICGAEGSDLVKVVSEVSKYSSEQLCYIGSKNRSEVLDLLSSVDCLVLPSLYDPFPMVVLESLSCGTPVLISEVCGHSSKVKKIDPLFVFSNSSIEDLSSQLCSILKKYQNDLTRDEIITKCASLFSIESVTQSLLNVYDKTIES